MKLKKKTKRIIIALLIILVIGAIALLAIYFNNKPTVRESKILKEIPEYGYILRDSHSKEYQKLFHELADILSKDPVDQEQYVTLISKMFIIDFYSLNSKVANTDVGGTDFIYQPIIGNFLENATNTIYKYVENNIYGQRTQKGLPTVKSVEIVSINQESFEYVDTEGNDQEDEEAFVVSVRWTYTEDNDYQTEAILVFIHNGIRLDLVELRNESNEE